MKAGIGLPSTIAGATREQIIAWAKNAETYGFSSLAVLDRLVYPNVEPLITLAAAAAITDRIELATTILIGPYRGNAALLAKQLASIDYLSGGRLVLGIAAGTRQDDYQASHVDYASRGQLFDAMLEEFGTVWSPPSGALASEIGPKPPRGRPTLIFGGTSNAAFRRAATHGDGWIMGGGDATAFQEAARTLATAWENAGRQDQPRTSALAYFALGPDGPQHAHAYLGHYYGFAGTIAARSIAESAPPALVRCAAGCGTSPRRAAANLSSCPVTATPHRSGSSPKHSHEHARTRHRPATSGNCRQRLRQPARRSSRSSRRPSHEGINR